MVNSWFYNWFIDGHIVMDIDGQVLVLVIHHHHLRPLTTIIGEFVIRGQGWLTIDIGNGLLFMPSA